jgi:hypothetical protein
MHPSTKVFKVIPGMEWHNPFFEGIPRKLILPVVYVLDMVETKFCKIGSTSNMRSRMGSFQTTSPFEIKCVYFLCPPIGFSHVHLEKDAQNLLKEDRARGEWFTVEAHQAITAIRSLI